MSHIKAFPCITLDYYCLSHFSALCVTISSPRNFVNSSSETLPEWVTWQDCCLLRFTRSYPEDKLTCTSYPYPAHKPWRDREAIQPEVCQSLGIIKHRLVRPGSETHWHWTSWRALIVLTDADREQSSEKKNGIETGWERAVADSQRDQTQENLKINAWFFL